MAGIADEDAGNVGVVCGGSGPGTSDGTARKMTWQEKLHKAKEYKAAGNELYKKRAYNAAISKYHRALLYIKAIDSSQDTASLIQNFGGGDMPPNTVITEEGKQESAAIKRDCYNNLSGESTDETAFHLQIAKCSLCASENCGEFCLCSSMPTARREAHV